MKMRVAEPGPGQEAGTYSLIQLRAPGARSGPQVAVSDELLNALRRAARINEGTQDAQVTFASLLLGLSLTEGGPGRWLRQRLETTGQALEALLRLAKSSRTAYDALAAQPALELPTPESFSASATRAIELGGAATGTGFVADVLMAMLATPGYHDADFQSLGIDRIEWAQALQAARPHGFSPPIVQPASGSTFTPEVAATAPAEDGQLDLNRMESHVAHVLSTAHALAGSAPITPLHILEVARAQANSGSQSFERLRQLMGPLPGLSPPSATVLPGETLAPELRTQLARAQRPMEGSTEYRTIWGRDLITAALLCPDDAVLPAVAGGRDALDQLRDAWYRYVVADTVSRPPSDWALWWREAGVPLPQQPRAGYAVENDVGEDRLGIGAEAAAFARLILDKDVKPPLSIGLLGDWGSGKSFFIEQIKRHIGGLLEEKRPELHASVVQIEFNAWHASDTNLWASLVTNIFDEIWRTVSATDENIDPEQARAKLGEQIALARGAVHEAQAQVETGRIALAKAEKELQARQELLALTHVAGKEVKQRIDKLALAAGWRAPIQTINDVDKAARDLLASGQRLRQIGAALLERPGWRIGLPVTACLALAWLGLSLIDAARLSAWQQHMSQVLTTVAGLVGAVIAPLKLAKGKVDALADQLGHVQSEFERSLKDMKASDSAGDAEKAQLLERARRELESNEERVKVARAQLAELMNQQVALDPAHRLGSFLQERVQSSPYRSQQGIISLVHKDFSELSLYMKRLREEAARKAETPGAGDDTAAPADGAVKIKPIDRIVLYVDDLDRCRPAQVVNMLEAVHLLLALDLFVVVVAVDSRWLTRALEVHYSELLGTVHAADADGLRESTPQNYLEKIFQITYALAPMRATHLRDYVDALAGQALSTPSEAAGLAPAAAAAPLAPSDASSLPVAPTSAEVPTPPQPPVPQGSAAAVAPQQPRTARAITIGAQERELIVSLAPLLGTPRLTKRLVNVYRVIKASKSADELDAFESGRRSTTCLVMLAILFGRPLVANELLRGIHEGTTPFDNGGMRLIDALKARVPPNDEPLRVTDAWRQTAELLASIGILHTVGAFAREPQEVARYSLASGHAWHTWQR
ncbi:P-loop NTPase fold protein [Roseateles sp. P5_D6]